MNTISTRLISLRPIEKFTSLSPWWIIAIGTLIRIAVVAGFSLTTNWVNYSQLDGPEFQSAGGDGYIQIARNLIVEGRYALEPGGALVPFRPPVQPFLMLVFGAWSPHYWNIIWLTFSLLMGAATLWALWQCAVITGMSALWTRMLMLVAALHPFLIYSTRLPALLPTLTLVTTFVLLELVRFIHSRGENPIRLGILWGIACLTHGIFLPLLGPFFVILTIALPGSLPRRLRKTLIVVITAILVITPWSIRNHLAFNQWFPVTKGSALQYWLADYAYFSGMRNVNPIFAKLARDFEKRTGEKLDIVHGGILNLKHDAILAAEAKQQIQSTPLILVRRLYQGCVRFWTTSDGGLRKSIVVGLVNLPFVGSYLIILGVAIHRRTYDAEWVAAQFMLLGYWSLFALVQAVGAYFVAISPCLMFVIFKGLDLVSTSGRDLRDETPPVTS